MNNGYFFEKKRFECDNMQLNSYYYIYKGYQLDNFQKNNYPIILYFKNDSIVFAYKNYEANDFFEIFNLSIRPGKLNQVEFEELFESYWKMPIWAPSVSTHEQEINFIVDKIFLSVSYFNEYYEFNIDENKFISEIYYSKKNRDDRVIKKNKIIFKYQVEEEKWLFENNTIKTKYINFRKLFLDFLYELNNSKIFGDKNFYSIQPALTNNNLLYALIHKCRYIDSLARINKEYSYNEIENNGIPKVFKEVEREWLNICSLKDYKAIFTSKNSIFSPPENEIDAIILNSKIKGKKRYKYYYPEDSYVWNRIIAFYLSQYSVYKSIKLVFANMKLLFLGICVNILGIFFNIFYNSNGFFFYEFPIVLGLFYLIFYYRKNLNLFKLLLPRLSLGILMGWLLFVTTGEEIYRFALFQNYTNLKYLNFIIFLILLTYIFTDIKNRMIINLPYFYRKKFFILRELDVEVFKKSLFILILAMLISLIQGIYITSFFTPSMLEYTGITNEILNKTNDKNYIHKFEQIVDMKKEKKDLSRKSKYTFNELFQSSYNKIILIKVNDKIKIVVIFPILLSQFLLTILVGVILQFLWEDRPITEPL